MASGFQGSSTNNVDVIVLLEGETAANTTGLAPPVLSATPTNAQFYDFGDYYTKSGRRIPDKCHLVIYSTAGSGVMTLASARVFLAHKAGLAGAARGGPYGVGADATKGMVNAGAALGETSADAIYHREELIGLSCADGIAVQLGAFGGTSPTFRVELHIPRVVG